LSGCGSELRVQVADPHEPSCRQGRSQEPSPTPLREICFWKRNGFGRALRAAAGPGRSEHRNVDILIPLARKRESPAGPNVPCERRTGPAEAPKNRSGAGSDRSKHWKRSSPSPRAQRESRSFPELPCERRFGPAEPPKIAAERDRSDACIGSDQTLPLAHSAKTNPPPSLPACIGPVPRSPPSNSARFTQAVPLIPSPA
jgi:hypothetical protein